MFANALSTKKRPGANIAAAIALMCGTALGVTALETPAQAQKDKKKKKKKAAKTDYSKEFMAAYTPLNEMAKAEPLDEAAVRAAVPGLLASVSTADDMNGAGGLVFNLGQKLGDDAMQFDGMSMMLESGKVAPEKLGQYNFIAYQSAQAIGKTAEARTYLANAIDANYSFEGRLGDGSTKMFGADDMRLMLAESYFDETDPTGGFQYLKEQIAERAASNGTIPEVWITRPMSVAYELDRAADAIEFVNLYVLHYPSEKSWGDAIALQRNLFNYDNQTSLDLLRLALRANVMREARNYVDYIEFADARRLPGEVKRVVQAGVSSGMLRSDDVFVAEANQIADGRIKADRADLPALERDARAASSTAVTASAAGDAFLSYGEAAKAEDMYKIALGKTGVDTPRVLTRLGIAQADQGKTAAAIETFAQVQGARKAIADLWTLYAKQNAAPATETVAAATEG